MTRLLATVTVLALVAAATPAQAQYRGKALGSKSSSYQSILNRPVISPYLNLLRPNAGPLPNYHTWVRPQLEQQEFNDQQTRQVQSLQRQVMSNRMGGDRNTGSSGLRPTGHGSTFMNYSHFYPGR